MSKPHLVIAAGGTGGHMFPAQALAEAMLDEGWAVSLSTDARGARYASGFPSSVTRNVIPAATFARGGLLAKAIAPFRIVSGVIAAIARFRRARPTVVVGFGGYPAFPAMAAAWALGIPSMIHEQNGVLGRVNRLFAARVNTLACSVWPTEAPSGAQQVHTGNPVRQEIRAAAGHPYPPMTGPLNIVIFGGSQGASILSDVVPRAIARFPLEVRNRLNITQQVREADAAEVRAAYDGMGLEAEVTTFIEDMDARLKAAHLVISRAGASSVADIATVGRPAIFVPLAIAIRDEQSANAAPLVEAGAAVILKEDVFEPNRLYREIDAILSDPTRAAEMAKAAAGEGRPDAVDALKSLVMDLSSPK